MNRLLLFITLVSTSASFAQADSAAVSLFKISPLHLFDLDNGLSFGYEKQYAESKSWQIEAGYGHSSANFWIALGEDFNGRSDFQGFNNFRLRTELRKYFKKNETQFPAGNYYAFEVMSKYVFKNTEIDIGRDPIGGQAQYFERVNGRISKLVVGSHFKLGRQFFFDDSKVWMLDVFAGIGFRVVSNSFQYESKKETDVPAFGQRMSIGTIIDVNRTSPIISGTFGLKFSRILP